MNPAYLGLGSNLGDRLGHLAAALRELAADPGIAIMRGSSIYESKPVGVLAQPDFLNMVVLIETAHPPRVLLAFCLEIETRLGRVRRERWAPRLIDLDVLCYDALVWKDEQLELPHPRMHERSFVLTPLAEISPELPLAGATAGEHAARLGDVGLTRGMTWQEFTAVAGFPQRLP